MDIKDRIRSLRKAKNLSQSELGEKTNIALMSISGIETGKTDPSTKQLKALSEFFNVSADYILFGIETERTISKKEQEMLEVLREDKTMTNAVLEIAKLKKKAISYARSYNPQQEQRAAMG
jgi:transcriptional regulator with XRE-family HTH domain